VKVLDRLQQEFGKAVDRRVRITSARCQPLV